MADLTSSGLARWSHVLRTFCLRMTWTLDLHLVRRVPWNGPTPTGIIRQCNLLRVTPRCVTLARARPSARHLLTPSCNLVGRAITGENTLINDSVVSGSLGPSPLFVLLIRRAFAVYLSIWLSLVSCTVLWRVL